MGEVDFCVLVCFTLQLQKLRSLIKEVPVNNRCEKLAFQTV